MKGVDLSLYSESEHIFGIFSNTVYEVTGTWYPITQKIEGFISKTIYQHVYDIGDNVCLPDEHFYPTNSLEYIIDMEVIKIKRELGL